MLRNAALASSVVASMPMVLPFTRSAVASTGKILDALETGYKEAQTAIFDANITNVIAAVLMFYFGSGPIRGFAVVLMIGIITSVFTAVNFTRMLVALWVKRKRPRVLHI